MDLGLVFDEEVESGSVSLAFVFLSLVNVLCLRHRVTFEVHLESVSWFQWLFGLWVDWTLDMRVFGFIDGLYHIEIALSMLFFSVLVSIVFLLMLKLPYSRVLGHKQAALRIYSGPKTNLFQRLTALR